MSQRIPVQQIDPKVTASSLSAVFSHGMAGLGWSPSRAMGFSRRSVLYFRCYVLAARFNLVIRFVDYLCVWIVFSYRVSRSYLVWLQLPTKCLDLDIFTH